MMLRALWIWQRWIGVWRPKPQQFDDAHLETERDHI